MFDSATPGTLIGTPVTVSGLQGGETLVGIDYRPSNGVLYGVGSTSRLYTIDTTSGAATQVGPNPFTPALNGTAFGVDFNPVPDAIRVVSDNGQNLRVSPTAGTATADTNLAYASAAESVGITPDEMDDVNFGATPNVVAAAYTNNVAGATATTLYVIDSDLDVLALQGAPNGVSDPAGNPAASPNAGRLFTVDTLRDATTFAVVDFSDGASLDIEGGTDNAFASSGSTIYSINLTTAEVTTLGTVGGAFTLSGLTIAPPAAGAGSVSLSTSAATFPADRTPVAITVNRTGGATGAGTVDFATADGTAVAGVDYLPTSGTLSFASGQTSRTIFLLLPSGTPTPGPAKTFTLNLSNPTGGLTLSGTTTATLTIPAVVATPAQLNRLFAVGASQNAQVTVYNNNGGAPLFTFRAFDGTFGGEVHVAVGDVNSDGFDDVIVGAGPGAPSRVQVIDGRTLSATNQTTLASFFAFDVGFVGGINVASGDINGDGFDEVIVGAGPGAGAHVKVFDVGSRPGAVTELASYFAYTGFNGGVTVASGNLNGDAFAEVITGAGAGGGPHVKVFDGRAFTTGGRTEIASFFAFAPGFLSGITVSAGDLNSDGVDDVIVGAQAGAGPHVKVFDGRALRANAQTELSSYFAFDAGFRGGVNVGARDLNRDGFADVIVGAGPGGNSNVAEFDGRALTTGQQVRLGNFFAFNAAFPGGVFVG